MDTERDLRTDSTTGSTPDAAADATANAASVLEAVIAAQSSADGAALRLPEGAALRLPDGCEPVMFVASLREAVDALRDRRRQRERRDRLPANVGKPWTAEQDTALLASFDAGLPLDAIATQLQRTRTGIRTRLERHGRLTPVTPASEGRSG